MPRILYTTLNGNDISLPTSTSLIHLPIRLPRFRPGYGLWRPRSYQKIQKCSSVASKTAHSSESHVYSCLPDHRHNQPRRTRPHTPTKPLSQYPLTHSQTYLILSRPKHAVPCPFHHHSSSNANTRATHGLDSPKKSIMSNNSFSGGLFLAENSQTRVLRTLLCSFPKLWMFCSWET